MLRFKTLKLLGIGFLMMASCSKKQDQYSSSGLSEIQEEAVKNGWGFKIRGNEQFERFEREGNFKFLGLDPSKANPDSLFLGDYGSEDSELNDPSLILPETLDWRYFDVVTSVKQQGSCGSCWAFGTTAAMESATMIHYADKSESFDLSEQQVLSCSGKGNCSEGGYYAFDIYVEKGSVLEEDFKYKGQDLQCKSSAPTHEKAVDWGYVGGRNSEPTNDELKRALYKYGPLAVTVYVDGPWSAFGGGGVFGVNNCYEANEVNHIVTLVGWTKVGENEAWIVKNSWGKNWGDDGYMLSAIKENKKCNALAVTAAYVKLSRDSNIVPADPLTP